MPPTTGSVPKPRILLAAPEVLGFAKTGGLADVAAALPRALARRGLDCAIVLPLYRCARTGPIPVEPTPHRFAVPVGGRAVPGRLWQGRLPGSSVPVYLVEQPDYFDRDDLAEGRGLYQHTLPDGHKRDYPDNCERFIFFCRAVLEAVRLLGFRFDVLHLNDWQTGLVPVFLREVYRHHGDERQQACYARLRTMLTIHNVAYQGIFWHWDMGLTGLDWRLFNYRALEFHGYLNCLKAGIVFADRLNTVSPTYAREIQTPYFGCGLHGVLAERRDALSGILNGIDPEVWDPATDPHLAAQYGVDTVRQGKAQCKAALQRRFGLDEKADVPLLGMIARLVDQKGIDLVCGAGDGMLQLPTQLVLLGEGSRAYQERLEGLRQRYPRQVGLCFRYDEPLAHEIVAGADMFLMPSLYEPSGLTQLYSMRYGTVPAVRATGGLADTVADATPEALADGRANGFTFTAYTADALLETVGRAVARYHARPELWLQLVHNGMRQDWSWDRSAAAYEALYRLLATPEQEAGGKDYGLVAAG
jgi:starch synthase